MNNVIQFPGKDKNNGFINSEVKSALEKLDKDTRQKIEGIIESTCKKYDFVCEPLNLSISEQATDDQVKAIKQTFLKQQATILELVNEVINQRIFNELQK